MTEAVDTIHATAFVLGDRGLLVRGATGAGKSSLAAEMTDAWRAAGRFAALVADDRVVLTASGGRLVASPHPATAGLLELRGAGIVRRMSVAKAVLHLCIDLDEGAPRLPETEPAPLAVAGAGIPRILVNRSLAPSVTRWRLESLEGGVMIAG